MSKRGFVYIIGVGPGSPTLLTLRAVEALERAEVVVYGNLVPDDVVKRYAKNAREIIKVTKKHRKDALKIVIEKALQGFTVAHLKNGDPTIYSNLNDEIEELEKHCIPYEIIPGVSSITAAAAEISLSLTDFMHGVRGFAVVNGHDETIENMVKLLDMLGMLVVLMPSLDKIRKIRELIPDACIIVVESATLPNRKILINTVPDVYESPTIVYVVKSREICDRICRRSTGGFSQ